MQIPAWQGRVRGSRVAMAPMLSGDIAGLTAAGERVRVRITDAGGNQRRGRRPVLPQGAGDLTAGEG